jgi:hypothetical protein
MSDDKQITQIILHFPHGVPVKFATHVARFAEQVGPARVSEGGFMPTSKYGLNVDDCKFSEDTMLYTYGYEKTKRLDK